MPERPDPSAILAMSKVAGVPIDQPTADRIARAIGPAFEGFAPGALAFDLEPSTFVAVQTKDAPR